MVKRIVLLMVIMSFLAFETAFASENSNPNVSEMDGFVYDTTTGETISDISFDSIKVNNNHINFKVNYSGETFNYKVNLENAETINKVTTNDKNVEGQLVGQEDIQPVNAEKFKKGEFPLTIKSLSVINDGIYGEFDYKDQKDLGIYANTSENLDSAKEEIKKGISQRLDETDSNSSINSSNETSTEDFSTLAADDAHVKGHASSSNSRIEVIAPVSKSAYHNQTIMIRAYARNLEESMWGDEYVSFANIQADSVDNFTFVNDGYGPVDNEEYFQMSLGYSYGGVGVSVPITMTTSSTNFTFGFGTVNWDLSNSWDIDEIEHTGDPNDSVGLVATAEQSPNSSPGGTHYGDASVEMTIVHPMERGSYSFTTETNAGYALTVSE